MIEVKFGRYRVMATALRIILIRNPEVQVKNASNNTLQPTFAKRLS
jgi:hypothetical protein